MPPSAWFPILDADVVCDDGEASIRWRAFDPGDDWSSGWQMVIDDDSRGLFSPGTIVTSQGGPAVAFETVEPGSYTQTLGLHWEQIPGGGFDRGFGTFSITATVKASDCTD